MTNRLTYTYGAARFTDDGRSIPPEPFVPITLVNPDRRRKVRIDEGLVDTGATYSSWPMSLMEELEVDPDGCTPLDSFGQADTVVEKLGDLERPLHAVVEHPAGPRVYVCQVARIFSPGNRAILGREDFLGAFDLRFEGGGRRRFHLEPTDLAHRADPPREDP